MPQPLSSENARLNALAMDIQAGSAESASAFQEIKRSVQPRARDMYSRWVYSYLAPSDFDDLYRDALDLAIPTFDKKRACIATWVIRKLRYACMEENRHRARRASLDRRELLKRAVGEIDPAKIVASAEESHIVEQVLCRVSRNSGFLLRVWNVGNYPLKEAAKVLRLTIENARKTRSRNLQKVRFYALKHIPEP